MKKTIRVTYGNSLTINRSNYENEKPLYSQTSEIELKAGEEFDETAEYARLRSLIDPMVEEHYKRSKKDLSNVRVRMKNGKNYPSVTSILNPLPHPIDPEYAIRGTEIHDLVNYWFDHGIWKDPSEPLQKIKYEDIGYVQFFVDNFDRITTKGHQKNIEVFNTEHTYSGEIDLICGVDGIVTLADIKTGSWTWEQLVAYYKTDEIQALGVKQLAVFDLKKQKLETLPIDNGKARKYWESFLKKRGSFNAIYDL